MQMVFQLRNCSIIRCDWKADWPQIGNGEKKQRFYDQNLFRGSLFRQGPAIDKIPGHGQYDMVVYQIEIICRSCFDYYTPSFIVSGLLYNMIFWHARDSPCRELTFPCHIFCWYCIEHSEPGAALPWITNFWIFSTSISSIGRGVAPVPVQITTAKVICQWRETE